MEQGQKFLVDPCRPLVEHRADISLLRGQFEKEGVFLLVRIEGTVGREHMKVPGFACRVGRASRFCHIRLGQGFGIETESRIT